MGGLGYFVGCVYWGVVVGYDCVGGLVWDCCFSGVGCVGCIGCIVLVLVYLNWLFGFVIL